MKIGFIGGGNMAQALIGGIARRHPDATFVVVDPYAPTRDKVGALPRVAAFAAPSDALADCDGVLLAVKPGEMRDAITLGAPWLGGKPVISIAAGTRTRQIAQWMGSTEDRSRIVRAMPNTPALICAGITGVFATSATTDEDRALAGTLLGAVGQVIWVDDEAKLDHVTAVSGSGPGYVFALIEALERGAVDLGISPDDARRLAIATFAGASRLAAESPESLATLRERVTSKGGTTHAGLTRMHDAGVFDGIVEGVRAASKRAKELGES